MRILLAVAFAAALAPRVPAGEEAAAEPEPAPLEIVGVAVEPASPGPGTLCELRVEIANRGREAASRFAFEVRVDGRALPVYDHELVLQPIPAGKSAVLRLHDFWSSETGRPFPPDGKLAVEVTLTEASRVRVEEKDGIQRRAPLGSVEGLPVAHRITLRGEPARSDRPRER